MKILASFRLGAILSAKAWKGVLTIWFISLFMVSMMALPMQAGIKSVFGRSMVTELLADGLNFDVLVSSVPAFLTILSSFISRFFLIILMGFLVNIFLAGGLFGILKKSEAKPTAAIFFKEAAANFWSFLIITFIMTLIILVLGFIVIGIPVMIASGGRSPSEETAPGIGRIALICFALILPVFILVTDYARVWQVSAGKKSGFSAIGFGFSQTFRTFLSSYPLMIVLLLVQFLYGWFVMSILEGKSPSTGGILFLFFLFSQVLVIIKIFLKGWRYGSVTALMEQNTTIPA